VKLEGGYEEEIEGCPWGEGLAFMRALKTAPTLSTAVGRRCGADQQPVPTLSTAVGRRCGADLQPYWLLL